MLVLVATLVPGGPVRVDGTVCSLCPADCPMHRHREAARTAPGCHRATPPAGEAPAGCEVRAACGHGIAADAPANGLAILSPPSAPVRGAVARPFRTPVIGSARPGRARPLDEPPRTLLSA